MLRESEIIVPVTDNNGQSLASLRDSIALSLSDAFGGVTMRESFGAWRDSTGKLYSEKVCELISAAPVSVESDSVLRRLASRLLRDGHQLAAYVKFPDSHVEIIEAQSASVANDNPAPSPVAA